MKTRQKCSKDNFKYFTQSGIGLNNHIIYFSCVSSDNIAVPTTRVHSFVFVAGNVLMEKRLCTATNSNITAPGEVSEPPEKTPPTQFKSYHFLLECGKNNWEQKAGLSCSDHNIAGLSAGRILPH